MTYADQRLFELRRRGPQRRVLAELSEHQRTRVTVTDVRCAVGLTLDTAIKEKRLESVARKLTNLLAHPGIGVYEACRRALEGD